MIAHKYTGCGELGRAALLFARLWICLTATAGSKPWTVLTGTKDISVCGCVTAAPAG